MNYRKAKGIKILFTSDDILAAFAFWGIRQSPYHRPDDLELILDRMKELIEEDFASEKAGFKEMTMKEIQTYSRELIEKIPELKNWNLSRFEKNQGVKVDDPSRGFGMTCGLEEPKPDYDFIGLDALARNVSHIIFLENYTGIDVKDIPDEPDKEEDLPAPVPEFEKLTEGYDPPASLAEEGWSPE